MDRPSRNRKAVNYSVFQDDDDEDFTCVKPPPKKARTAVSERNHKTTSASQNEVVILTSPGSRKRASLDDKLYDRDLETALTLSLLSSPRTQDGEPTTKTDDCDVSQPAQCSPPVLIHCSADASHIVDDSHPHSDLPPVLSNCCIDGRSLGLNLISMDASPTSVSKQTDASEEQKKRLKEKDNKVDEDYQPQNTPDSESDADFAEEDESEDETFTVKNIKVVKLKTEKKAPPPVKDKKEKKDKKPMKAPKASKAKTSAPSSAICRSPAAPVSGLKKTPNTPPISKPALCSSPAGGKLPKWNPPGLVGRSPGASQNAPMKSPGQGLRLGLSRRAPIKPLHQNAAVN